MFSAFCEILCARTRRARSYALKPLADLRRGLDLARFVAKDFERKALDLTPATSKDLTRILRVDLMALSAPLDLARPTAKDLWRGLVLDLGGVAGRLLWIKNVKRKTAKDLWRILCVVLKLLGATLDLVCVKDLARKALDPARILRVDLRRGLDLAHIIAKDLARILLADLMRGLGAGATVTTPATTAFARRVGHINPALSIAGYNFQGDLARLKLRFKNA